MSERRDDSAPLYRAMRAVTFSAAGTLLHSPRAPEHYRRVLERHGYPEVSDAGLEEALERVDQELACRANVAHPDRFTSHEGGTRGFWHRYLERLCEHLELEPPPTRFASAELYQRFSRSSSWTVYEDVVPALEKLRESGLLLAVVSNWDERLPALLDSVGLAEYFSVILTSAECGVEKPSARIWKTCLRRIGARPQETLHVGDDKVTDFEGAQAAGLEAWWLDRPSGAHLGEMPEIHLPSGPRRLS
ncbi:MAG: HAD-IA family hydrolase [Acidobacteriota bacterium]